ncbi:restriction endonuclease [Roseovarius sp. A46]|nr:restriction endonuclease [Roseovarius sp. A46]
MALTSARRRSRRRCSDFPQIVRVMTEAWAATNLYCPNCGHQSLTQYEVNRPVADFFCSICCDDFELKSSSRAFGKKMANGAYETKMQRLASDTSPNLVLLRYDLERRQVRDLACVPRRFFVHSIIEARKPLAETARRRGWIGSNILLHLVPKIGRIDLVRNGETMDKRAVLEKWRQTAFLEKNTGTARGWLVDVMICIERLEKETFSLTDIYECEGRLEQLYPENQHVRAKIRQQLQVLRDNGYLVFLGNGEYRKNAQPIDRTMSASRRD